MSASLSNACHVELNGMLAACTEAERAAVLKSIRLTVRDEASNPAAAAAAARRGGRPVKMMRPTASGHAQQSM